MERSDKRKRVAVVPGDGIGKEVIPAALKVVEATGAAIEFTTFDWSADRYLKDGTTVPPDGFAMLNSTLTRSLSARSAIRVFLPIFMPKKSCWACASKWISMPMCVRSNCWMKRSVRSKA